MMKKNYAIIVMVMIAPSPGPLSKHFGKTVDAILRRDNIEDWVDNKDNIVAEETNADEETGKVIVVNVQEEDDVVAEDNAEDAVDEDEDVVILSETLGDIVVKEEPVEEVVVDEDDNEIEESNDSIEVHVEDNDDIASEADTDFTTPEEVKEPATEEVKEPAAEEVKEPAAEEVKEPAAEEVEDDIVYYKDAQVEYEFGELRKENGVYFVPLTKPVLIQTPVIKLVEPISGDSTIVRVSGGFAKFVKNHEENMLKLTKENKTKWFKNGIDDSALDNGFKSFLESDTLKVKISDDFAAFDTAGDFIDSTFCTPAEVRCILKISGLWFGSAEFGSIMSLVQTQLAKLPKCSIKPTRERKKYNYSGDFA